MLRSRHEIIGFVRPAGPDALKFAEGDVDGGGCFRNSRCICDPRSLGLEQSCEGPVGAETQEALDVRAPRRVQTDVEQIRIEMISEAFDRMNAGDMRYRFVIDMR